MNKYIHNNIQSPWQQKTVIWLIRCFPVLILLIAWFWMLPMFTFGRQIDNSSMFGEIIQYVPNYTVVNNLLISSIWEIVILIYILAFLTLASKVVVSKYFQGWTIFLQLFLLIGICVNAYMLGEITIVRWQLSKVKYIAINANNLTFLNQRDYSRIVFAPFFNSNSKEADLICVKNKYCYLPVTDKVYITYSGIFYYFINHGIMHSGSWSANIRIENNIVYVGQKS